VGPLTLWLHGQPRQPAAALQRLQGALHGALSDPKDCRDPRCGHPPTGHALLGLVAHAPQQDAQRCRDQPRLAVLRQPDEQAAGQGHPAQPWRDLRPQQTIAILGEGLLESPGVRQKPDGVWRPDEKTEILQPLNGVRHRRQAWYPQQAAQFFGAVVRRDIGRRRAALLHQLQGA
jgi:hypothetical protein